MTPETSSSTAIDWEVLSDFLMSDRTPDTGMRPAEVDGYLTGIAVSPDRIPPSDWLPVIWGGGEPEFTGIEEASRVLGSVLRHYSTIRLMLDRTPEASSRFSWTAPLAGRSPRTGPGASSPRSRCAGDCREFGGGVL